MSIITNLEILPYETREKISKDLEIKIQNKFNPSQVKYLHPFSVVEDDIKLPFAYAVQILNLKRRERSEFSSTKIVLTHRLEKNK